MVRKNLIHGFSWISWFFVIFGNAPFSCWFGADPSRSVYFCGAKSLPPPEIVTPSLCRTLPGTYHTGRPPWQFTSEYNNLWNIKIIINIINITSYIKLNLIDDLRRGSNWEWTCGEFCWGSGNTDKTLPHSREGGTGILLYNPLKNAPTKH